MPILVASDVVISTWAPLNERELFDPTRGYEVVREPQGDGRYVIKMASGCTSPFGCTGPDQIMMHKAFFYYLETGQDLLSQRVSR